MANFQFNLHEPDRPHDELTSSGYEIELFVDSNRANEFLCVICQLVVRRPKTHIRLPNTSNCKVIFCTDCLKNYVRHYNNSPESQEDAPCPFRCGASLIVKGGKRNIGGIPRNIHRKISSLRMLCPSGRGTVRYAGYEAHIQANPCGCSGLTTSERTKREKQIDFILKKICDNRCDEDELLWIENFAQIFIETTYPD
uniref:RING-type domain-containing protein n=1 Tax=Tetranychus urticae TaxID=32264 RepID=T1JWI5_TETUR